MQFIVWIIYKPSPRDFYRKLFKTNKRLPMTLYELVKKYKISKTLFIVYFTFCALIIYFFFNIFFSQKGLIKYFSLKQEIEKQEMQKHELRSKIDQKKNRVEGMNSNSLDLDLLDEEARKNLGHSSKNEIVIYDDEEKKKRGDKK